MKQWDKEDKHWREKSETFRIKRLNIENKKYTAI